MLDKIGGSLTEAERDAVAPIFQVPPEAIDGTSSTVSDSGGLLECKFVSVYERHCPFQLHFSRREPLRFNFFVGLGAEFYNYESLEDPADRAETAQDVERFLKSTVRCEQYSSRRGFVKEVYAPSLLVVDGQQIRFVYRAAHSWLLWGVTKKPIIYSPWLP